MYVCLCKGISNRSIRRLVEEGARSVDEIGARCGAGTSCGTCRLDIEGMLKDARSASACERGGGSEPLAAK